MSEVEKVHAACEDGTASGGLVQPDDLVKLKALLLLFEEQMNSIVLPTKKGSTFCAYSGPKKGRWGREREEEKDEEEEQEGSH